MSCNYSSKIDWRNVANCCSLLNISKTDETVQTILLLLYKRSLNDKVFVIC